jgi:hypothetical protein
LLDELDCPWPIDSPKSFARKGLGRAGLRRAT